MLCRSRLRALTKSLRTFGLVLPIATGTLSINSCTKAEQQQTPTPTPTAYPGYWDDVPVRHRVRTKSRGVTVDNPGPQQSASPEKNTKDLNEEEFMTHLKKQLDDIQDKLDYINKSVGLPASRKPKS